MFKENAVIKIIVIVVLVLLFARLIAFLFFPILFIALVAGVIALFMRK